jgi:hypothetical protein
MRNLFILPLLLILACSSSSNYGTSPAKANWYIGTWQSEDDLKITIFEQHHQIIVEHNFNKMSDVIINRGVGIVYDGKLVITFVKPKKSSATGVMFPDSQSVWRHIGEDSILITRPMYDQAKFILVLGDKYQLEWVLTKQVEGYQ